MTSDEQRHPNTISNCIADVPLWCASRRLQLNAAKTEAIWFGSRANLRKLTNHDCSVRVESEIIQPSTFVRDLGIYLDAELTMKQHVSMSKAAAAFFRSASTTPDSNTSFGSVPYAEIHPTATAYEVWRTCLQLRQPSPVELTSKRHPAYSRDIDIQKDCSNLIFFAKLLTFCSTV